MVNAAKARGQETRGWQVGQRVRGHYLGHAFAGRVKAVRQAPEDRWHLTVVFDEAVDVVASDAFSNFRKHVNVVLCEDGTTQERTANGQYLMKLK